MYLRTDGDVVEDPLITNVEIELLTEYKEVKEILSGAKSRVLDLCCGQGSYLIDYRL